MKHTKLLVAGVVVALVLAAFATYKSLSHENVASLTTATPGSLLIEQYSPYVQQNGGISSALPIQTTSDITAATLIGALTGNVTGNVTGTVTSIATSSFADVSMSTNATTSLKLLSTSSTQGGCIQIDATSTATHAFLKLSPLGATSTFAGTVYFGFGSCE